MQIACWQVENGACRLQRRYLQITNRTCSTRTVLATCSRPDDSIAAYSCMGPWYGPRTNAFLSHTITLKSSEPFCLLLPAIDNVLDSNAINIFYSVNSLLYKKSFRKRITKYIVSKYIWLIRPHCVSSFIISTATVNICIEQMCICTIYKMYTSYCHFPTRCMVHITNSSLGWRGGMSRPSSL